MQEKIKVAAAQLAPVYMDKQGTVDKACKAIEEAGRKHAELIVFPEVFIPGYPYWRGLTPISRWTELMVQYQKNSLLIPSSDTDILSDAAKNANIICAIGCTEQDDRVGSGTLYNTLLFIDNKGKILGRHRKLMPIHAERVIWGMGDGSDLKVFNTQIGRLGGLICYEHHMTLLKAALALKGEEIHCAVWPGWWVMDRHPGAKKRFEDEKDSPHLCDIEYAAREYAFENQTFIVSVCQYIPKDDLPEICRGLDLAAGGSSIINPAGIYLVEPVFNREEIIYATLDADDRRAMKAYFDAVGHNSRWDVTQLYINEQKRNPFSTHIIAEEK